MARITANGPKISPTTGKYYVGTAGLAGGAWLIGGHARR